jgi:ribonucleotide reductase beta subunit family protein with ferritin-like domain
MRMEDLDNKLKQKIYNKVTTEDQTEYLLNPENNRLTIYPIKNKLIWDAYKRQQASIWFAEEIDFSKDFDDFNKLSFNEQYFIKMILGFFSASDTIVNINLVERFINDVKIREAITVYTWQMAMELIHCVSGDTQILLDNGYYEIERLNNKCVNVWNGKEFSSTHVKYTGDSELYEISLSNGMTLKCTPKHKWFIKSNMQKKIIFTDELKVGYIINNYDLPIINPIDPDNFINPYIHGLYSGNTFNEDNKIYLYSAKIHIIDHLNIDKSNIIMYNDNSIIVDISSQINKNKLFVPINYSIATKLRWLEGLIDNYYYESTIQIVNNNHLFLTNVQLLLTTLSINSEIMENKLCINPNDILKLKKWGFNPKTINLNLFTTSYYIIELCIINIKKLKGYHKTYCFTEEKEHAGIFNGILTGQSETYSLQIDNIIKDKDEKAKLFDAVRQIPCISEKVSWSVKWIESSESFPTRLIAFAIVEGIFFSGSFCAIFWLKKRNIMAGLCTSNELISRDESLHCNFAVLLYSMIQNKLSETQVHEMFNDAVLIESKFICESLSCALIGMNAELMTQYIKYVADRLLVDLNYSKLFNVTNPFDFMESISIEGKTNFFEARPTQYQRASILNKSKDDIFTLTDNF